MSADKKERKNYSKQYRNLIKAGCVGAAGFCETDANSDFNAMEVAIRYLQKKGSPILTTTQIVSGRRLTYVEIIDNKAQPEPPAQEDAGRRTIDAEDAPISSSTREKLQRLAYHKTADVKTYADAARFVSERGVIVRVYKEGSLYYNVDILGDTVYPNCSHATARQAWNTALWYAFVALRNQEAPDYDFPDASQ
jgi:hypothetical protein